MEKGDERTAAGKPDRRLAGGVTAADDRDPRAAQSCASGAPAA